MVPRFVHRWKSCNCIAEWFLIERGIFDMDSRAERFMGSRLSGLALWTWMV
jgi:hypothetical protein